MESTNLYILNKLQYKFASFLKIGAARVKILICNLAKKVNILFILYFL